MQTLFIKTGLIYECDAGLLGKWGLYLITREPFDTGPKGRGVWGV